MTQDKRHIPQAADAHNKQTRPADTGEVDKLRENPHNDEKTISQNQQQPKNNVESDSTFARKDDEGRNQVTNEQEQNKVVNPGEKKWESKAAEEEPGEHPETPTKDPYEEIGDDPDAARKKLPKM